VIRLVSLARVKHWVNAVHDADDAKLDLMILAASQAVMDYLGMSDSDFALDSLGEQEFDSDGNPVDVGPIEQAATAIMVGKMYDGMDPKDLEYGRLPIEVTSMLYVRRRDLGVA
jgi:hypothetical protein